MNEYIKRNDVIDICEGFSDHCFDACDFEGQDIVERIEEEVIKIPTADVMEVVRCEKCKHYDEYNVPVEDFDGRCTLDGVERDKDFHCAYGEKK